MTNITKVETLGASLARLARQWPIALESLQWQQLATRSALFNQAVLSGTSSLIPILPDTGDHNCPNLVGITLWGLDPAKSVLKPYKSRLYMPRNLILSKAIDCDKSARYKSDHEYSTSDGALFEGCSVDAVSLLKLITYRLEGFIGARSDLTTMAIQLKGQYTMLGTKEGLYEGHCLWTVRANSARSRSNIRIYPSLYSLFAGLNSDNEADTLQTCLKHYPALSFITIHSSEETYYFSTLETILEAYVAGSTVGEAFALGAQMATWENERIVRGELPMRTSFDCHGHNSLLNYHVCRRCLRFEVCAYLQVAPVRCQDVKICRRSRSELAVGRCKRQINLGGLESRLFASVFTEKVSSEKRQQIFSAAQAELLPYAHPDTNGVLYWKDQYCNDVCADMAQDNAVSNHMNLRFEPFVASVDGIYPAVHTIDGRLGYHVAGNVAITSVFFNMFCGIYHKIVLPLAKISRHATTAKELQYVATAVRNIMNTRNEIPLRQFRAGFTVSEQRLHEIHEALRTAQPLRMLLNYQPLRLILRQRVDKSTPTPDTEKSPETWRSSTHSYRASRSWRTELGRARRFRAGVLAMKAGPLATGFGHRIHGREMKTGYPEGVTLPCDQTAFDPDLCNIARETWSWNCGRQIHDAHLAEMVKRLDNLRIDLDVARFWELPTMEELRADRHVMSDEDDGACFMEYSKAHVDLSRTKDEGLD
ncbi:hypothetical protein MMC13_007199 [Lambiella insularis]|nr:hypothetical protein [Lambiella insularis]